MGGVATNVTTAVLDVETDEPIPGLFAAGECVGGIHGACDNAVSQTSCILVHLVGLGPGHHDHRDGALGTDGFDVLLEILLEERNTLFSDGFARHALQENNVEHLRRVGLHVGIHLVRGEVVLDVVEAQHASTNGLQACLPVEGLQRTFLSFLSPYGFNANRRTRS